MSLQSVERISAESWLKHIQSLTKQVDWVRTELAKHIPKLAHNLCVDEVMGTANSAVANMDTLLDKRRVEFDVLRHAARSETVWKTLRQEFVGACMRVQWVCWTLHLLVGLLVQDEGSLPIGTLRTADEQRHMLANVRIQLVNLTNQYLVCAELTFVTGEVASSVPSLLES